MNSLNQSGKLSFPILLVDDDPTIVDVLQHTAKVSFPEAEFIPITTFEEATAYLYNLEGKGPRLVLLDISLPGGHTGFGFLSLLKAHPLGKLLPVIILSQSDFAEHIKDAYQLGAAAYLVKPYTLLEWRRFLENLRLFWYETATLPQTYFDKQQDL